MRPGEHVVLTLRQGGDVHALPVHSVEEVLPALPIEPVPNAPAFLRGVVFVRGHLIPVLNAAERLKGSATPRAEEPQIVCLRSGGRLIGLEVDEALDLLDIRGAETLPLQDLGAREGPVVSLLEKEGQVIRLLDPDRLLIADEASRLADLPRTAPRPPGKG